jgi:RNA polymerase sigma factor (TIGR02999 family)
MPDSTLTEQLRRFSSGDREMADVVIREVLPELHKIAVRALSRERSAIAVSPSDLIQEVWLKHLGKGGWRINDRGHFFAIAARAMRQTLVSLARRRLAQRHGAGDAHVSLAALPEPLHPTIPSPEAIVQIAMLIEELEKKDPEVAQIVDMHYIAGFTHEEIAKNGKLTLRQVRHRWEKGQDWLKGRLVK